MVIIAEKNFQGDCFMKIEKINENKIKVLIDIDEAKEWK